MKTKSLPSDPRAQQPGAIFRNVPGAERLFVCLFSFSFLLLLLLLLLLLFFPQKGGLLEAMILIHINNLPSLLHEDALTVGGLLTDA